ncbi:MAG: hypothetical protein ABSD74_19880 [Rhizomicrobium sp.]|jgi:hypothetical protein
MGRHDESEERQVLCSGCLEVFPESGIKVIPTWSEDLGGYVSSFRCARCRPEAITETAARLHATTNEDELASFGHLLERHGIVVLEFKRGDPLPGVRHLFVKTIELIDTGAVTLSIAPAIAGR